jgi:signal transduction histidine kinase/HAMP domain-containing protein
MKKMISIRTKLISGTMLLISVIFILVLSIILTMNIVGVEKNISKAKESIRTGLITKGKTLVQNNSMAMSGMAEDNAFTAIQALVSSTLKIDDDIIYGIYMNDAMIPWAHSTMQNPDGIVSNPKPMTDSISKWAFSLNTVAFRDYTLDGSEVIEFAAPVISGEEKLGVIRYGISTQKMKDQIRDVLAYTRATRNQSILILILLCLISLVTGFYVIRRFADKITRPIEQLVKSSETIANGDYNQSIAAISNDEIGNLAHHFELMRTTIKRYTDHLQDLIDEKMQQVNDILNNIDQGLFTINLDGSVNKEYSARANEILKVDDIASHNINQLLRLDAKQNEAFCTWLNLVKARYKAQRWQKLVKLAPVQELELMQNENADQQYVSVSYQKIYDKNGELSKIMVLAMDITEKRMKNIQMSAERQRHENEVKTILGIANTPPEEISEFNEDTADRLNQLHMQVKNHLDGVTKQREQYPEGPEYIVTKEQIDAMYRHTHTIKGNAGSYGFELLSIYAHKAEDMLEELREPVKMRRENSLAAIAEYLNKMDEAMQDIHQKIKMVFGRDDEITVRVPENRIRKIQEMCAALRNTTTAESLIPLYDECMMLTWKPLKALTRKYLKSIQKAARAQNKNVHFEIDEEMKLYPAEEFSDIDEVLIHLIRNSVDHGIEEPEVREEHNKGIGRIRFEYRKTSEKRVILLSDDGRGIDTDKLVEKSIQKGIITPEIVLSMSDAEKINLIFHPGISTADKITNTSGRGIGMNVVYEKMKALGGNTEIKSRLGKGTSFILTIPCRNYLNRG